MDYQTGNSLKYRTAHPFAVKRIRGFFDRLAELVKLTAPARVLDIGCGEGFGIKNLCARTPTDRVRYWGLDLSLEALRVAQGLLDTLPVSVVNGDIYHLPFRLDRFDIVLCLEVLEHLARPETALKSVSQYSDGFYVFSVPNEPFYRLTRLLVYGKNVTRLGDHPEHVNHWSRRGFVRLLSRHFTVERVMAPFPWTMVLCSGKKSRQQR